jgi:O-antigen ligase
MMEANTEISPIGAVPRLGLAEISVYPTEKLAGILERISFSGLLLVITLAAIPYGAVEPWWTALINCLIFVLVALRIVEGMLRRDLRVAGAGMIIPLLALCVFAGFQAFPLGALKLNTINSDSAWKTISTDPHETVRFVFRLLACVLAGESLLRYTSTRRRLTTLVVAVVGIGVLSAGFGIARQMGQTNPAGFILPRLPLGEGYGQLINQNHFALLMEMSLGVLLGLVIGKAKPRSSFFPYLSMSVIVWAALIFTNSRGGVISMFGLIVCAALSHLAVQRWRSSKRQRSHSRNWMARYASVVAMSSVLAFSLILLTAVGVAWVGGDPVVHRLEKVSGELNEGGGKLRRQEIWRATWHLIKAHPLTGIGFGGYEAAIPEFNTGFAGDSQLSQAHNDYLEILASGGIVGAIFALWFLIVLIRRTLGHLRDRDSFRYSACLGAFAAIFAVCIHSFFDFGLHITVNALVFTCLVVIATANCSSETQWSLGHQLDQ